LATTANNPSYPLFAPAFPSGIFAATAVGERAIAAGTGSLAIGDEAIVGIVTPTGFSVNIITVDGGTAVGSHSLVSADSGTAIGFGATATADNSVAIGAGSIADVANTVSVGAVGFERQVVNVAAGDVTATSTYAVNGSQLFATNQNVATNTAAIAALQGSAGDQALAIADLQDTTATHASQITAIEAVNSTQSTQISGLQAAQASIESDVDTLFDLRSRDRRDMKQGIAAAMAIAPAPMPSEPGRISYAVNGATFRGEYALGGSLMYRLPGRTPFAVNVGFSYGGNKNNGARIGVAGEF
jgi:autotransporter adhesin